MKLAILSKLPVILEDLSVIADAATQVALKFQDVPGCLKTLSLDLWHALKGTGTVQQILDDVKVARTTLAADANGAGPEFDALIAALSKLIVDVA